MAQKLSHVSGCSVVFPASGIFHGGFRNAAASCNSLGHETRRMDVGISWFMKCLLNQTQDDAVFIKSHKMLEAN